MEPRIATQTRVICALIMREMSTRYGRSAGGYLWAVIDPLGFIVLMSLVFSQIAHAPPIGDSFPLFYATGYMAFHFYLDISASVSGAIQFNKPLLAFPRITLLDTVIARFVLQVMTACFVSVLILSVLVALYGDQVRLDPAPLLLAIALATLLGLGVASINCVLFLYSESYRQVFGIVNRPLFLISGIFFTYESMPPAAQDVLWWNPLMHVTALMRAAFYPVYEPTFVSVPFVLLCALTPLMLGVLLLRILRRDILEA